MNSDEIRALCDWYLSVDRAILPDPPFELTNYQTVTGAEFFSVLTREALDAIDYLNGIRSHPPVRMASLIKDLQALKSLSFTQIEDYNDW